MASKAPRSACTVCAATVGASSEISQGGLGDTLTGPECQYMPFVTPYSTFDNKRHHVILLTPYGGASNTHGSSNTIFHDSFDTIWFFSQYTVVLTTTHDTSYIKG